MLAALAYSLQHHSFVSPLRAPAEVAQSCVLLQACLTQSWAMLSAEPLPRGFERSADVHPATPASASHAPSTMRRRSSAALTDGQCRPSISNEPETPQPVQPATPAHSAGMDEVTGGEHEANEQHPDCNHRADDGNSSQHAAETPQCNNGDCACEGTPLQHRSASASVALLTERRKKMRTSSLVKSGSQALPSRSAKSESATLPSREAQMAAIVQLRQPLAVLTQKKSLIRCEVYMLLHAVYLPAVLLSARRVDACLTCSMQTRALPIEHYVGWCGNGVAQQ